MEILCKSGGPIAFCISFRCQRVRQLDAFCAVSANDLLTVRASSESGAKLNLTACGRIVEAVSRVRDMKVGLLGIPMTQLITLAAASPSDPVDRAVKPGPAAGCEGKAAGRAAEPSQEVLPTPRS